MELVIYMTFHVLTEEKIKILATLKLEAASKVMFYRTTWVTSQKKAFLVFSVVFLISNRSLSCLLPHRFSRFDSEYARSW
jgi:hypothetical protein